MKAFKCLYWIVLIGMCAGVWDAKAGSTEVIWPDENWARKAPGDAGLDAGTLQQMSDFAGGYGCIIRGGYMVYAWGDVSRRKDVASAVKPVYTHFLLKAIEDGRIDGLDEKVVKWEKRLQGLNQDLGHKDQGITWRHLCNQISGYGVKEGPGDAYDYSDWNMALLFDTLFLKVYGTTWKKVDEEVLRPILMDVIGCQDEPTFMAFGTGNRPGRLAISPRDFARFGLLYLRAGKWRDKQVLSEELVRFAPRQPLPLKIPRTQGEKAQMIEGQRSIGGGNNQCDHLGNYSNAWWINGIGRDEQLNWPDVPKDVFGCFGHGDIRAVVVMPSLDVVVSWNDTRLKGHEKVNRALQLVAEASQKAKASKSLGEREALMWEFEEWEIAGVAHEGSAFDVEGVVTFRHVGSGRKRRTQVFYKGGERWALRFAPTLTGLWDFKVKSDNDGLDGYQGGVRVKENPDTRVKGFLTHVDNKFVEMAEHEDDLRGYLFNVYMGRHKISVMLEDWGSDLDQVEKLAQAYYENARHNGFEIVFVHVSNNWFQFGDPRHSAHQREHPDPVTFAVLETIITTVHKLGGRVHLWAWGDESRKWTPRGVKGGINGPADRRLQQYIAARLGPLPGWTMGYGFDLHEWVNSKQLNAWATFMHEHLGWQHLLCARAHKLSGPDNVDSYGGFGRRVQLTTTSHGPKDFAEILEDMASDLSRPQFYEERHSFQRDGFDLDMDGTRRLLWWETVAGGMGGFFGFYPTSPHPYPNPEQLRTHYEFWHTYGRFSKDMKSVGKVNGDTYVLSEGLRGRRVVYREDAESMRLDLQPRRKSQPVVAVDTKKAYREITVPIPDGGLRTWKAPYKSDWALAIGDFTTGEKDSAASKHARIEPSRISVDAENRQWLQRGKQPFFMCGPGDPEGFLYRGALRANGTRDGDQMALIEKLKGTGANCIYLMAVRSHGGDGDRTHNPFIDHDPARRLDERVLEQWERWFDAMDEAGIVIYLFIYDDSARIWHTGDEVGNEEKAFLHGLVNRFEHHGNLIWCVAEEYGERLSAKRVSGIAAEIRSADNFRHPIAVHKNQGLDFSEFAEDENIDQFAIQYNVGTAEELHAGMVQAFAQAQGRYSLNMSECAGHGTGKEMRLRNWACAMGGASVMILGMDIAGTRHRDLLDCGFLVSFFESTDFDRMTPRDELAYADTEYVLAHPGESYIAYSPDCREQLGLKGMSAGNYLIRWVDCANHREINQGQIKVDSGNQSWEKPKGLGAEAALYVRRIGP